MVIKQTNQNEGHFAKAKTTNLPISTKHSVEISRYLRYKTTLFAKNYLQEVVDLKKAIPFKKFNRDTGHKVGGMAAGRYPQKAAKEFLKLVGSVESNAQVKGLNTSNLKISKLIANKASIPMTGGRHRSATKRTHLEIEVVETIKSKDKKTVDEKESKSDVKVEPKIENKVEEKKLAAIEKDVKTEAKEFKLEEKKPKVAEAPAEVETKEETKVEELKPEVAEEKVESKHEEPEVKEEAQPVVEEKKEEPEVEKIKSEVKEQLKPVKELSSEDLLEKAQEVAAELNKKEKQTKDVEDVSSLYDQLQKKGTLREGGKQ